MKKIKEMIKNTLFILIIYIMDNCRSNLW